MPYCNCFYGCDCVKESWGRPMKPEENAEMAKPESTIKSNIKREVKFELAIEDKYQNLLSITIKNAENLEDGLRVEFDNQNTTDFVSVIYCTKEELSKIVYQLLEIAKDLR